MIHLNIGSNLNFYNRSRFDNISIAAKLLIDSRIKVKKISNFYETPSYPNKNYPKFLNIGILAEFEEDHSKLFKLTKSIEKKLGRIK